MFKIIEIIFSVITVDLKVKQERYYYQSNFNSLTDYVNLMDLLIFR